VERGANPGSHTDTDSFQLWLVPPLLVTRTICSFFPPATNFIIRFWCCPKVNNVKTFLFTRQETFHSVVILEGMSQLHQKWVTTCVDTGGAQLSSNTTSRHIIGGDVAIQKFSIPPRYYLPDFVRKRTACPQQTLHPFKSIRGIKITPKQPSC